MELVIDRIDKGGNNKQKKQNSPKTNLQSNKHTGDLYLILKFFYCINNIELLFDCQKTSLGQG